MKKTKILVALGVLFGIQGCGNIGNAPEPMTADQVNKTVSEAKPEDQIAYWQSSPLPAAEKQKKIDEIRQKYNLPADAGAASGPPPNTGAGH